MAIDDIRHAELMMSLHNVMRSNGAKIDSPDIEHFLKSNLKVNINAIDRLLEGVPEGGMSEAEFAEVQQKAAEDGVRTMNSFARRNGITIT